MSGVKGRSGGPRANSGGPRPNSGGKRPGAGRPKKAPVIAAELTSPDGDPMAFLTQAMLDAELDVKLRIDAAKALMPFKYQRVGEEGKKQKRQKAAEKVAGRFSRHTAPRLVALGGKRV